MADMTSQQKHDAVKKAATDLRDSMQKALDGYLVSLGVDKTKDQQAYYRASRYAFRGLVAAAAQRMFEDGADRKMVSSLIDPYHIAEVGFEVFLDMHPEMKAKLMPEPKMPPAKHGFKVIDGGLDDIECPECGETGCIEKADKKGDEATFHCSSCDTFFSAKELEDEEEAEDGEQQDEENANPEGNEDD